MLKFYPPDYTRSIKHKQRDSKRLQQLKVTLLELFAFGSFALFMFALLQVVPVIEHFIITAKAGM